MKVTMTQDSREEKSMSEKSKGKKTGAQQLTDDETANTIRHTGWKAVIGGAKNWNVAMVIISLLPLVIYLLALPYMPDIVPAHYNARGELDRWGSKYEGLFFPLFSLLMCAIWLVCEVPVERSAQKQSGSSTDQKTTVHTWVIGGCCMFVVFNVMNIWIIADAFSKGQGGVNIPLEPIMNVVTGLVFIVLGNILPNTRPNRLTGIRVSGAYKSRESWRRCQRFGGLAFIIGGVVLVVLGITVHSSSLVNTYGILAVLLVIVVACYAYSVYAGKKYGDIGGKMNHK
ncbi:DUF1648 domain-containing protein [Bifidobacterium sp. ESL0769]|uniref:DUF1648 domain-containing protein n=1 Tax=Bifidobacterium sp. ESL0769 TaxID=2983229 RepID=UPI0023F852D0|nr:DUF1648 domain-containing protein [Bifidobacterium sp. ESL0769]WEV68249.1 DUF1648 domain-containing protein [Bifidobacterium sp. ESL0769]